MNWWNFFKKPFHVDAVCNDIVWGSGGTKVLSGVDTYTNYPRAMMDAIVDILNEYPCQLELPLVATYKPTNHSADLFILYNGQEYLLNIRGWGFLTGVGGMSLDVNTAVQIQDSFGKYIVDSLNEKKFKFNHLTMDC